MKRWAWLVLATIASAFLFQAALPPVGWSFLGWFCFVPTLFACRGKGFAVGFASGLFAVVGASILARYGLWCKPVFLDEDPGWIYTGFALFGLPVGLLHGIVGEAKTTKWWTPFLFAGWAVLFEALLLLYLPAHVALTQSRHGLMLGLASVAGIWGVSYVVWAVNLVWAETVAQKHKKGLWAMAGATAIVLLTGFPPVLVTTRAPARMTAVQANGEHPQFLVDATTNNGPSEFSVTVWPEGSGNLFAIHNDTRRLSEIAARGAKFATTYDDDLRPRPHNTMSLFDGSPNPRRYWKRKLFGGEARDHTPGSVAVGQDGYGFNICFDSCFPSVIRETANLPDVRVILLPTLDPSTPYAVTQAIHAAYTPFRAAENGITIVRAEATAYSMIVSPEGAVWAEAPAGVETVISAPYLGRFHTVYGRFGDWFLYACGLAVLAPLALKLRERASKSRHPN